MKPQINIRNAQIETDLTSIVRLINPFEINPVTEDQLRGWFQRNPPGRIQLRLVTVDESDVVTGYACVIHEASAPVDHYYIWLVVDPAHRRLGIGSALWIVAKAFLQAQGATRLGSEVRDDDPIGLAFAEQRGFAIDRHYFGSSLDLLTFDETPYLPIIATLAAEGEGGGIRFCSLADFPNSPETRRKLYDLNAANVLDIPGTTHLPWSFAEFEKNICGAAWFQREGQLLAVDGDTWVGLTAVSLNHETHTAYNEHTGVLPAYRGRKIAQALKVMAAIYARQQGARQIGTHNDSHNAPMLAINRKMGYQPQTGNFLLVRWLDQKE